jgi:uncharacterized protein YaeQ
MALTATMHRFRVTLSDVDRGVYESLDLRAARHPSESVRYLVTRVIAYSLEHEEGIAFSKGGLSSTDEPPVSVVDPTGALVAWIDVGTPSADRLHRAAKAAPRVAVYTHADPAQLHREAASRAIHRVDEIEVWRLDPSFLDAVGEAVDRNVDLEIVRTGGRLYVTIGGRVVEGDLQRIPLGQGPG